MRSPALCLLMATAIVMLFSSPKATAQPKFPCDGIFRLTRQYPAPPQPNSYISQINFSDNNIVITNPGTMAGGRNVNASVFYNGYIWAQDWTNSGTNLHPFTYGSRFFGHQLRRYGGGRTARR